MHMALPVRKIDLWPADQFSSLSRPCEAQLGHMPDLGSSGILLQRMLGHSCQALPDVPAWEPSKLL